MFKKIFLVSTIIFGTLSFAHANQIVCRGFNTTLKLTDFESYDDGKYVVAQVWSAKYENAKYPDLFNGSVNKHYNTVEKISKLKALSVAGIFGTSLNLNLEKKILVVKNSNGELSDQLNCKIYPQNTVNSDYLRE